MPGSFIVADPIPPATPTHSREAGVARDLYSIAEGRSLGEGRILIVQSCIALFISALVTSVPSELSGVRSDAGSVTDPAIVSVTARLVPGSVVPRPLAPARARGSFSARFRAGARVTWFLTYSSLSGPVVAAHVHLGKPGKRGPIAIRLCPPQPCRPTMRGTRRAIAEGSAIRKALVNGRAYVDVHTRRNPRGEIRGQTEAVQTLG